MSVAKRAAFYAGIYAAVALTLAGCGLARFTSTVTVPVRVPVPVYCEPPVPAKPQLPIDTLAADPRVDQPGPIADVTTKALWASLELLEGWGQELLASVSACRRPDGDGVNH